MNFAPKILTAAKFERDRRAERYPSLVAEGKLEAAAATLDYQAWCAIAALFEIGQFEAIYCEDDSVVGWPEAQAAAERALAKVEAKAIDHPRIANLRAIHRAVEMRRQSIDSINAELRRRASVGVDGRAEQESIAA